ncbi:hypothetical protein B1992_10565 [Pseudoxanthomonas broegbernensis]|uniref:Uncharacterized protein n=1 Tax=Pseudoxanthomonas broegbernensis TaxID=83619 RepID=A0A7V8GLL4_9GAMM|nr:hypothetical protein [Pseudoxanthomonas broegbernensis]KAF1685903.1 hypothetical protein B1992_10565 [Pseudoxanthomonas broegbernensis]MBB6064130.1 hypothetical protein [Pseudoxanthomonas broegbernensis]
MSGRAELDQELDRLEGMLPLWTEKLRHRRQFWPQFGALAGEIIDRSAEADLEYVLRRLARMIRASRVQFERWR